MPKLDIPFLVGQDESWDKKVLPVGPMRAVRNMKLEHNAELKRNAQLKSKAFNNNDQAPVVGYGYPNQLVQQGFDGGSRYISKYVGPQIGDATKSYDVATDTNNRLPLFSNSKSDSFSISSLESFGDSIMPQAVKASDGKLYTSCAVARSDLDGQGAILIERRDPDTLVVLDSGLIRFNQDLDGFVEDKRLNPENKYALLQSNKSNTLEIVIGLAGSDSIAGTKQISVNHYTFGLSNLFSEKDSEGYMVEREVNQLFFPSSTQKGIITSLDAYVDQGSDETFIAFGFRERTIVSIPTASITGASVVSVVRAVEGGTKLPTKLYESAAIGWGISICASPRGPVVARLGSNSGNIGDFGFPEDLKITTRLEIFRFKGDGTSSTGASLVELSEFNLDLGASSYPSGIDIEYNPGNDTLQIALSKVGGETSFSNADSVAPLFLYYNVSQEDYNTSTNITLGLGRLISELYNTGDYQSFGFEFSDPQEGDADSVQGIVSVETDPITTLSTEATITDQLGIDRPLPNIDVNPPKIIRYNNSSGERVVIFPTTAARSTGSSCSWKVYSSERVNGVEVRSNETMYPGSVISCFDQRGLYVPGFLSPASVLKANNTGTPGPDKVTQFFAVVARFTDANGRVYKSAPEIRQYTINVTIDGDGNITDGEQARFSCRASLGMPDNVILEYYCTVPGDENSLLRLFDEQPSSLVVGTATSITVPISDDDVLGLEGQIDLTAPAIYTAGGVINNDPPPSADFIVRTRDRVWVSGMQGDRSRIQASKFIREGVGLEWSSLDQFFVDFPEDVVGMGVMDTQVVVLTRHGIFQTGGAGPDNLGIGFFNSPQTLPGRVGCKSKESIVTARDGVYFLSDRGIEKINRGFAAPTWDGETVRDTIEEYPVCAGSAYLPTDDTIRWAFMKEDKSASVVVVKDLNYKTWYVYEYEQTQNTEPLIGIHADDSNLEHFMTGPYAGTIKQQLREDLELESTQSASAYVTTGDIRVGGINGWGLGKKLHILGEYRAPCALKVEMVFNGQDFGKWEKTWSLTDEKYSNGEQLEMRISLPVIRFSNCKFRISWDSNNENIGSFIANGISLYYSENTTGGVRTQARNQG